MIKSRYRWEWRGTDEEEAKQLASRLGVPLLVAKVLVARGLADPAEADVFLNAGENGLEDPLLMKGMPEAAERIRKAIRDHEKIRIYGDYDADGVTSTALVSRLFSRLGASFDTYIPHRSREGYGLNKGAIDLAFEAGISLLVTVDNGISAVEQIHYAREKGIDVVVTDHHEPPSIVPSAACALVNPKQHDCPYPFKGLAGAGVAFKLAHALLGRPAVEYADLAAIGTIADLMPLTGENRIIARLGLALMRSEPSPGIRALAAVSGVEPKELSSGKIGFSLAPRLNAGGRLDSADGAVRLLVTDHREEADGLASELDRLNTERQLLVEETVKEAETLWQRRREEGEPRVIVLAGEGWNPGIAGLVASKLVEKHYRPTIVLACDPESGMCKGSARSIDGFDIYAALSECADCMDHFGGHQAAAGMTLPIGRVKELEHRLHRIAGQWLSEEDWQPKRRVDLECSLDDASLQAVAQLARLEPFGSGNPAPKVLLKDLKLRECRVLGKEGKHLRLTAEQGGRSLEAVAFGAGDYAGRLSSGASFDFLGELSVNEWNGSRKVQLVLQDFRSLDVQLFDRRESAYPWSELEKRLSSNKENWLVLSASSAIWREATAREGLQGASVTMYADGLREFRAALDEAAAAREMAAASEAGGVAASHRLKHAALIGLPDNPDDAEAFEKLLLDYPSIESVHVYSVPGGNRRPTAYGSSMPDRTRFAEVYGLFKERQSWIDGPDGFLRQVSERTGMPLAVVRMMQEVFEELGFIRSRGAEKLLNAAPERKPLEGSARYQKAKRQSEAFRLAELPTDQLAKWLSSIREAGLARWTHQSV